MFDLGGWQIEFWLMTDITAVATLGIAIVYGNRMWRNRPKDPVTVRASDEATRHLYHHHSHKFEDR